jgi:predicted DNA-binding transcriptional regulator YafY
MRRADRLFQIVQILSPPPHCRHGETDCGEAGDLGADGLPRHPRFDRGRTLIDGEAGVGYRLQPGYDLPPLMFDREEIQALVLGARIVAQFGDPALARQRVDPRQGGRRPAEGVGAAARRHPAVRPTGAEARRGGGGARGRTRGAARGGDCAISYANEKGEASERTVRPLGVFFWGKTWTLAAWCEMRTGFRNFRLDRIETASIGERFEDETGRTLRDMLAQYGPAALRLLD